MDPATRQVRRGDTEITLTAKDYALLATFLRHPDMVLTREVLLHRCWDLTAGTLTQFRHALDATIDDALADRARDVLLSGRDAHTSDGHLVLRVCDHGPGIPPDFLPKAFDWFTRSDTAAPVPVPALAWPSSPPSPATTPAPSWPPTIPTAVPRSLCTCPPTPWATTHSEGQ
jgi:hypothetical protein